MKIRPYDMEGFTDDTEFLPVRGTVINLVAIDGFATIATGETDNNGDFSFLIQRLLTTPAGAEVSISQVISKTAPNNPAQIEIRNNTTDEALLSLISSGFDDSSGTTFLQSSGHRDRRFRSRRPLQHPRYLLDGQ
ncbi:MAG: hypothetical protein MPW15_20650 [Candidatus Manganitrophus sp.]|nr:hypothetical protein [Candidatus Manganitrophus sp.]